MDAFFRGELDFRNGWRARERMRLVVAWVIGLALMALALSGAEPERAGSPYFAVKGAERGVDALPLKSTDVQAVLVGPIAEVRVTQVYANEGGVPLEARYVFPGSTRAAVHAMTMTVGGRRIDAVIKEKGEARKTYEKAKSEGRTAALLEAARSNVFEMNVGNILPGDVVTVELRYSEMISPEEGRYEWVFPTVVGPRYAGTAKSEEGRVKRENGSGGTEAGSQVPEGGGQASEDGRLAGARRYVGAGEEPVFTLEVEIVTGVPVREVTCGTHKVETRTEGGRTRVVLPVTEDAQMNRDCILRYRLAGDAIAGGLMVDEWKGEKYFMLTLQPPARVTPAFVPPRDFVFVVDVSGSMHGFPLETAKKLMSELLMSLREADSFNVLLFSGGSRVLSGEPVAATPENIAAALAMLGRQQGGGSTELLPALKEALELPKRAGVSRSVVVVTDGYVMVEAEAYALVREKLSEANLFSFGIGSSVNRELIERLARAGRAEAAVIEGEARVVEEAAKFRAMIESPVLTQVRTEFVDFATREVFPQVQPDVLAARPLVVIGKFSGEAASDGAGGKIVVKGFSGGGVWEGKVDVGGAVDLRGSGVLAQLWARERLEQLRDLHAVGDEPVKRKEEIVALGLKYNLLTPYTSFVAVDTVVRKAAGDDAQKVDQTVALPEGMSAGEGVPTTPEPGTVTLMVMAALVVAWGVWRERKRVRGRSRDNAGHGGSM
ncbi:VIT and vWA domain-containing protein [Nibricoccus aquaticus]|nr:VIT domain-containing protein [Nibricoccus aquaticus]